MYKMIGSICNKSHDIQSHWYGSDLFTFCLQLEYEKRKKEEGKRARADKQQVLDMLFSAFEKHQYYNIKDLVDITKQPVVRLEGSMSALVITLFILTDHKQYY